MYWGALIIRIVPYTALVVDEELRRALGGSYPHIPHILST